MLLLLFAEALLEMWLCRLYVRMCTSWLRLNGPTSGRVASDTTLHQIATSKVFTSGGLQHSGRCRGYRWKRDQLHQAAQCKPGSSGPPPYRPKQGPELSECMSEVYGYGDSKTPLAALSNGRCRFRLGHSKIQFNKLIGSSPYIHIQQKALQAQSTQLSLVLLHCPR